MKLIYFCWFLLITVTLTLLIQAFSLQIIQGKEQSLRASQNRFRIKTIEAQRGIFYDRLGKPLLKQEKGQRIYLYPQALAHVLGYLGEADEQELSLFGLEAGRLVGKLGLEREENGVLKGIDGGIVEEVSATGEQIRQLSQVQSTSGRNVQLNIDLNLQQAAYKALEQAKFKGAVVASTPDGKLLALSSYPSYDPNIFLDEKRTTELESLFQNPDQPMFDRAIAGLYPPASTFKIITSLSALEEGVINEQTQIEDTGQIKLGEFTYGNWYYLDYGRTEGMLDLVKALQRSNDIFFYHIGEDLGIEKLAIWAKKLGLGSLTGIAINGEAKGLVPDPDWKKENMGEDWYVGDTYITSIGQGNLQATPIQINHLTAVVASGGFLCKPSLVAGIIDDKTITLDPTQIFDKRDCQKIALKPQNLELVKNGMVKVCEPGGTAYPLFNFRIPALPAGRQKSKFGSQKEIDQIKYIQEASGSAEFVRIPVACKTGTAETGKIIIENNKEKHLTHAWLTAFAPVQKPEIVVTVLLEDAGQGSDKAAPIARDVLQAWFEREN